MYVNPYSGRGFPVSAIQLSRRTQSGAVRCTVAGEEHEVHESAFQSALEDYVQAAFPAPPGTRLIHEVSEEGGSIALELAPVIGFMIDGYGLVRAVTAQGIDKNDAAIVHADGRVEKYEQGPWESVDAYREWLRGVNEATNGPPLKAAPEAG